MYLCWLIDTQKGLNESGEKLFVNLELYYCNLPHSWFPTIDVINFFFIEGDNKWKVMASQKDDKWVWFCDSITKIFEKKFHQNTKEEKMKALKISLTITECH